jgi:hypothetical protein
MGGGDCTPPFAPTPRFPFAKCRGSGARGAATINSRIINEIQRPSGVPPLENRQWGTCDTDGWGLRRKERNRAYK